MDAAVERRAFRDVLAVCRHAYPGAARLGGIPCDDLRECPTRCSLRPADRSWAHRSPLPDIERNRCLAASRERMHRDGTGIATAKQPPAHCRTQRTVIEQRPDGRKRLYPLIVWGNPHRQRLAVPPRPGLRDMNA